MCTLLIDKYILHTKSKTINLTTNFLLKKSNITKDFNKKEEKYKLDLKLNISEGYIGILISKIL